MSFLRVVDPGLVSSGGRDPVDLATLSVARSIVDDVRARGEAALRDHAERLGDVPPGGPLTRTREDLAAALARIPAGDRGLLERVAARVRAFADAQRRSLVEIEVPIPGGRAGHSIAPVDRAGCYAPGGRFPLPSSVLMTAVTARAAGVPEVWVASPRPADVTLAAAAVAGADGFLAAGGAQAVAALALGAGPVPACDAVVGPGNRFVTAAKQIVAGRVAIDMLAGPSELVVVADGSADPGIVAADLLAQAEHDPDARPILVALGKGVAEAVDAEIERQLPSLANRDIARRALGNGFAVVAGSREEAASVCDSIAPEHLEIATADPEATASLCHHWGGLFLGEGSAEVLGDYGAGPNHTLPTGGTARHSGGLSVLDFLRVRTWIRIDDPAAAERLAGDAERLARLEGLDAHAAAARRRIRG